jgi:hypothetical protein
MGCTSLLMGRRRRKLLSYFLDLEMGTLCWAVS